MTETCKLDSDINNCSHYPKMNRLTLPIIGQDPAVFIALRLLKIPFMNEVRMPYFCA